MDELGRDPRRGIGLAPDRAQGAGQYHRGEGQVHRHPPGRSREPCATSSAPTRRPSSGRSPPTPTTRRPDGHPDPRGQALSVLEPDRPAAFQRRGLYLMDVSGSMTDDQKEIVRIEAFWIDTWLKSQYDGVTTRYIIHDAVAREVDEHTFYHTRRAAAPGSARPTTWPTRSSRSTSPPTGTSTSFTSPTATTGARTTASASACFAIISFPSATSSATDRSKAPTAPASSTASWKRRSRKPQPGPLVRSVIRIGIYEIDQGIPRNGGGDGFFRSWTVRILFDRHADPGNRPSLGIRTSSTGCHQCVVFRFIAMVRLSDHAESRRRKELPANDASSPRISGSCHPLCNP